MCAALSKYAVGPSASANDEETFDAIYGGPTYRSVKDVYDPDQRLTGLYEKAVGRK